MWFTTRMLSVFHHVIWIWSAMAMDAVDLTLLDSEDSGEDVIDLTDDADSKDTTSRSESYTDSTTLSNTNT